jgi:flagellin-like hook-associated protein FlgL
MEFQTLRNNRSLYRTVLFASAASLACSLVALPVSVDPLTGSLTISAAWAKSDKNGNGGGHGNSGGHSGGAGAGGAGSGNAGGASSNGSNAGGNPAGADAAAASASTNASTVTGSTSAVVEAQKQLDAAQAELAAANKALASTVSQGDDTKVAIARGRVAGAEYAKSSAEMNAAAAQAGVTDVEPAAD